MCRTICGRYIINGTGTVDRVNSKDQKRKVNIEVEMERKTANTRRRVERIPSSHACTLHPGKTFITPTLQTILREIRKKCVCVFVNSVSVRVLQRGKSIHKIVHNVSLAQQILSTIDIASSPLSLHFLPQRRRCCCRSASLHRYERGTARLKPRRDPPQRLALPSQLLFLTRAEESLVASGLRSDRCASVGLDVEYVRFECEWVDELEKKVVGGTVVQFAFSLKHRLDSRGRMDGTYVCVYVLWERVDVRWEFYLVKKNDTCINKRVVEGGFVVGIATYWSRHA